jgi:hypothetical protein
MKQIPETSCVATPRALPFQSLSRPRKVKASLLVSIALIGFNPMARAAVEVIPSRIDETRTLIFVDDKVSRTPPSLKLTLSVIGPEAEASTYYGNVKIDEAIDDQGVSLAPAKDAFHAGAKFKEYSNAFFRKSNFAGRKPAAPQVEFEFAPPARGVSKIAHLRGSLELADAGTVRTIEVAGLKSGGTKTLAIPAAAKVQISATASTGDNVRSISVDITGDESAVESVEIIDAAGQKVSNGLSSWSINGGPAHKSLGLKKALDDEMKLVVKIIMDRKIVTVPFDLKDVSLP